MNDDVIECAGLLGDVKLTFGLPDHAKFEQAAEAVRAYGNSAKIMDEADTFFWKKYAVFTEKGELDDVISTFIRIVLDWDYEHFDDDSKLTHDDRVRLFRILWDKHNVFYNDVDPQINREKYSDRNKFLFGETCCGGDVFDYMMHFQKIKTMGEEVLLQWIRVFDANLKTDLRENYLSSKEKQLIDALAINTGDFDEWGDENWELREAKSFCDILFCALRSPDARVKQITESVIAVLREKAYQPDWVRRDENHSRPKRHKTRKPPIVRRNGNNSVEYQDYLERATAYLRSPTQDRPEWVGGEFFEREIFFHNMERKNYSVDFMRRRFAERYKETMNINYEFLIEQGVLTATVV